MTDQHTPGPWSTFKDAMLRHTVGTATGRICDMWGQQPAFFTEEDEANARLIAASPALLVALRDLMDAEGGEPGMTEDQKAAWLQAVDAIAKATGEVRA